MGDSCIGVEGVEHAFLAMIRLRETIPARALGGLADLAVLEAAVLAAKCASAGGPPETALFLVWIVVAIVGARRQQPDPATGPSQHAAALAVDR
jgi:hypothetical protein